MSFSLLYSLGLGLESVFEGVAIVLQDVKEIGKSVVEEHSASPFTHLELQCLVIDLEKG